MNQRQPYKLDWDAAYFSQVDGNNELFNQYNAESYLTIVMFILPVDQQKIRLGEFKTTIKGLEVKVHISILNNKEEDPLYQFFAKSNEGGNTRAISFRLDSPAFLLGGCPPQTTQVHTLYYDDFSDNRGHYPCVLAKVLFPYRLASWFDPDAPQMIAKAAQDEAELAVMGPPNDQDKVQALMAVSNVIREQGLSVAYENVTVFSEIYFLKENFNGNNAIAVRLAALASQSAFKNAVKDYFLGQDQGKVLDHASAYLHSKPSIKTEEDLFRAILGVIDDVLIHHIEDRRWIEPFWDWRRMVDHQGVKVCVPEQPKGETKIQPTLHVLLVLALESIGIQVVRESDEGAGNLDFKCLYTTPDGVGLNICIEFKLAHHRRIEHGITLQLPTYMKANRSKHGIFLVMWFRDEKGKSFSEPSNWTKDSMESWLLETARELNVSNEIKIECRVIDASLRPSASKT